MKSITDSTMTFKEAKKKLKKKLQDEAQIHSDKLKSDFKLAINQDTPQGMTHTIEIQNTFCEYVEMNRILNAIRKLDIIGSRNSTQWNKDYRRKDTCIVPDKKLNWEEQTKCTFQEMEKIANYILQDKKDDFYICLSNIIKNKRLSERITRNIFGTAIKHKS